MDFTLKIYLDLLDAIQNEGYECVLLESCFSAIPQEPFCILRHDVDRRPDAALRMARLEHQRGFRTTYLFRYHLFISYPALIQEVVKLGHSCGYHYEELAWCKGRLDDATALFKERLERVREVVAVKTTAMHGNPWSKWDNRILPQYLDYEALHLLGDAYHDIDYRQIYYLTDTGRLWNDRKYNIRDFAPEARSQSWRNTPSLIRDIRAGKLPPRLMLNTHPGRWNEPGFWWWSEKWGQAGKNLLKAALKYRIHR